MNVILAVFNLIPLPPLDGSVVLERFMPRRLLPGSTRIRPFTMFSPLRSSCWTRERSAAF